MTATATTIKWERTNPGEWVGKCAGEIECHINERIVRGESMFRASITAPWIAPAAILLADRDSLTGAMTGFEEYVDSSKAPGP